MHSMTEGKFLVLHLWGCHSLQPCTKLWFNKKTSRNVGCLFISNWAMNTSKKIVPHLRSKEVNWTTQKTCPSRKNIVVLRNITSSLWTGGTTASSSWTSSSSVGGCLGNFCIEYGAKCVVGRNMCCIDRGTAKCTLQLGTGKFLQT